MKLRLIIFILSLLAISSAVAGGSLYYSLIKQAALKAAERENVTRAESIRQSLSNFLSENIRPVKTLAGMQEIEKLLESPTEPSLRDADKILDHFKSTLNANVCYVLDRRGDTLASTNRDEPDSFVGRNFSFRPYFKMSIHGKPATYLALGTTSGIRGVYFSHPIYGYQTKSRNGESIGVAVIKTSIEQIEKQLHLSDDETVMVADPNGVIFISSRKERLFKTVHPLTEEKTAQIADSLQFGPGPWTWSGLSMIDEKHVREPSGVEHRLIKKGLDGYDGWRMFYFQNSNFGDSALSQPFIRIARTIIVILCVLISFAVIVLYKRADDEILKRKAAEKNLEQRKNRYRYIYHHAPAMLHSVNKEGLLTDVSDNWLKNLGYDRDEVIGKAIWEFLTEESGGYVKERLIPDFFQRGYLKDVPYRFKRKDGTFIDTVVSSIGERDESGTVIRSLTVSIDVTKRKMAEEELKRARDELRSYSRDLEKQVKIRTEEITSILKYTPNVVSIKDTKGRYLLVNQRFEELFGIENDDIRGKTSHECLPKEPADQFCNIDKTVLGEKQSCKVEYRVSQPDGVQTYLSVNFPIYDDSGRISGVGCISTDITELKKAECRLSRLSGSVISNQEKERAAIARELHDEFGQMLTVLRMDAVWIEKRIRPVNEKIAARVSTMCEMIDKSIEDVRNIAMRLRPGVLDTLGLVDALEWYTADFEKRTGITCVFENETSSSVGSVESTVAYRITQESLTNVVRHASATRVDVVLQVSDSLLMLTVADNGKGFDVEILEESEGLGVTGMRERAALVGGVLDVESLPGEGTRVCFSLEGGLGGA